MPCGRSRRAHSGRRLPHGFPLRSPGPKSPGWGPARSVGLRGASSARPVASPPAGSARGFSTPSGSFGGRETASRSSPAGPTRGSWRGCVMLCPRSALGVETRACAKTRGPKGPRPPRLRFSPSRRRVNSATPSPRGDGAWPPFPSRKQRGGRKRRPSIAPSRPRTAHEHRSRRLIWRPEDRSAGPRSTRRRRRQE